MSHGRQPPMTLDCNPSETAASRWLHALVSRFICRNTCRTQKRRQRKTRRCPRRPTSRNAWGSDRDVLPSFLSARFCHTCPVTSCPTPIVKQAKPKPTNPSASAALWSVFFERKGPATSDVINRPTPRRPKAVFPENLLRCVIALPNVAAQAGRAKAVRHATRTCCSAWLDSVGFV